MPGVMEPIAARRQNERPPTEALSMTPAKSGSEQSRHSRPRLAAALIALVVTGCGAPNASSSLDVGQPDPLHPATIVWLAGEGLEVNDITVAVRLTLGRGDGTVLWRDQIELDPSLPSGGIGFVSGPAAGAFTYALVDAGGARVHVVSATDLQDRVVATIEEPLVSGSIDPSGHWIYVATRSAAEQLRISRLPANGGEVEHLADLGPEFLPNGVTSPQDLLRWTPDGRRLLIQACDAAGGCWWQILDRGSGELTELRPAGAELAVGVTNDTLLAIAAQCAVGPCPFVLVDLATGESRPFDPHAHEARTAISQDGRTVILYDNQGVGGGGGTVRVTGYDPATGMERVLYESEMGFGLAREGQGTWAPDGWFVVASGGQNVGEGGIGPVLIRIADGLEVRLAPLSAE
jgi:hypothetical protein